MRDKILHSLKWSASAEITTKILPPVLYLITARLLTPEDFGIVAISAMILAFASILWEAGLSKALIQTPKLDKLNDMSNIVFYTNIVLGLLIYVLVFLFAEPLALFFKEPRIEDVIKISGLAMIIGSFSSVQTALLQKDFGFKRLFYSRLVSSVVPGVVSVVMAYQGYGYWSLVWGSVVSVFFQAVILWKVSHWRPTWNYDIALAKDMITFSKWVLASALLSWFFIWGDLFVLGYFFSPHEMGLYRTGNYFVGAILGLVTAPIAPVMYSYFSKIQHDKETIKKALLFSSKVISFFVLPIGLGIYLVQTPLADSIFGSKWEGIAPVIGYLAIMYSVSWIIGLNSNVYKALGRPDLEAKILIFSLFFYFVIYMITAQISFEIFLIARMLLAVASIFVHIYASKKLLGVGYSDTIKNIYVILLSLLSIYALDKIFFGNVNTLSSLFLVLILGVAIYIILIKLLDGQFLAKIMSILKNRKV